MYLQIADSSEGRDVKRLAMSMLKARVVYIYIYVHLSWHAYTVYLVYICIYVCAYYVCVTYLHICSSCYALFTVLLLLRLIHSVFLKNRFFKEVFVAICRWARRHVLESIGCSIWFGLQPASTAVIFVGFSVGDGWHELMICASNHVLGGGFKQVLFTPILGEMIQFDEHIFQMGGSTTT